MHAISTSPAEVNCAKCLVGLETESLKCSRCSSHMHLRCSDLPVYMLLRLKTSQASYNCRACVLGEGDSANLSLQEASLIEIMEREEAVIKDAAADGSEIDEVNTINEQPNPVKRDDESSKDRSSKSQVCKFYMRKECRHGVKGKTCNFEHPALCYKYIRNGTNQGGCKKASCNYFHPKLCRDSLNERKCYSKTCRFYHVNGTKREPGQFEIHNSAVSNTGTKGGSTDDDRVKSLYSEALRGRDHSRVPRVPQNAASLQSNSVENNTNNNDNTSYINLNFLELKKQIQELVIQMSQLATVVNTHHRGGNQCCPQMGRH